MKWYRRVLILLIILDAVTIVYFTNQEIRKRVPAEIWLRAGCQEAYDYALPFSMSIDSEDILVLKSEDEKVPANACRIDLQDSFVLSAEDEGQYQGTIALFGFLPIRTVRVEVTEDQSVYACGTPIGIYLETDGLLVLGTGEFPRMEGGEANPAEHIVKSGDYILAINDQTVQHKEELIAYVQEHPGEHMKLCLRRGSEQLQVQVKPELGADGVYRLGIWIRDDSAGIGTMTYLNPEKNTYGALGHGISDGDTGELFEIVEGELYPAKVHAIVRGKKGSPGELVGTMCRSEALKLAEIGENTNQGIFGTLEETVCETYIRENALKEHLYPIGLRQEIRTGRAEILSAVEDGVRLYEIEIVEVRLGAEDNKGIIFEVTDAALLQKTGGIVQGMSGSPIIQDGRLIGAVTHVFVNHPDRGYGTFIENMLAQERKAVDK